MQTHVEEDGREYVSVSHIGMVLRNAEAWLENAIFHRRSGYPPCLYDYVHRLPATKPIPLIYSNITA